MCQRAAAVQAHHRVSLSCVLAELLAHAVSLLMRFIRLIIHKLTSTCAPAVWPPGMQHFDLSYFAFEQLFHPVYGVGMVEYRTVDCETGRPLPQVGYIDRTALYSGGPRPGWGYQAFSSSNTQVVSPGEHAAGPGLQEHKHQPAWACADVLDQVEAHVYAVCATSLLPPPCMVALCRCCSTGSCQVQQHACYFQIFCSSTLTTYTNTTLCCCVVSTRSAGAHGHQVHLPDHVPQGRPRV
jgi:hypothetical protein